MSTLKIILFGASIQFGVAYMNYNKGGLRDILLLLLFAGSVIAYHKVANLCQAEKL